MNTDLQNRFLDALFGEAKGDIVKAAKIAGYNSPDHNAWRVARALKDEILSRTKEYLAVNAPKAAFAISSIESDPSQMGSKDRLAAAKEILDRAGVVKRDEVTVALPNGIFLLPPKDSDQ